MRWQVLICVRGVDKRSANVRSEYSVVVDLHMGSASYTCLYLANSRPACLSLCLRTNHACTPLSHLISLDRFSSLMAQRQRSASCTSTLIAPKHEFPALCPCTVVLLCQFLQTAPKLSSRRFRSELHKRATPTKSILACTKLARGKVSRLLSVQRQHLKRGTAGHAHPFCVMTIDVDAPIVPLSYMPASFMSLDCL